jgi:hypothetical protein
MECLPRKTEGNECWQFMWETMYAVHGETVEVGLPKPIEAHIMVPLTQMVDMGQQVLVFVPLGFSLA